MQIFFYKSLAEYYRKKKKRKEMDFGWFPRTAA